MNKIIRFSKARFYMIALTSLLIVAGFIATATQGGFNLGIDFQAGLSQRFQVAPVGLEVTYSGADQALLHVSGGVVRVEVREAEGTVSRTFPPGEYASLQQLASGIQELSGVQAQVTGDGTAAADTLVTGLGLPYELTDDPVYLNFRQTGTAAVEIQDIRRVLEDLGAVQVQQMGNPVNQEFLVRVEDTTGGQKDQLEARIAGLIEGEFGANTMVLKQSDYVGPRFSEALARQSALLTIVALLLILLYVWFRFRLGFAVSSISALAHDLLFMLAFIGAFQIEVNTATIAAILTIIGYSLNDTIVIFDRIRENVSIHKQSSFARVVDTSITQSLSRTLITSMTTLLAVTALFIFGTGMIRDFALNLIVGVVVGTYSSIFVASPVLVGWMKRAKKKLAKKLGKDYVEDHEVALEAAGTAETQAQPVSQAPRKELDVPEAQRKLKGKRKQRKK